MALPLLPAEKIEPGLAVIREFTTNAGVAAVHTNALNYLFAYIQEQWIQSKYLVFP